MNPPLTQVDVERRCRMMLRAFTWDKPLPPGYAERMRRFDSGEDRTEEHWGPEYRLTRAEMDADRPEACERIRIWRRTT